MHLLPRTGTAPHAPRTWPLGLIDGLAARAVDRWVGRPQALPAHRARVANRLGGALRSAAHGGRWLLARAGAALLLGVSLPLVARYGVGASWLEAAALATILVATTALMLGFSLTLRDGADAVLAATLASWTAALLVSIGLGTTPLAEDPLRSAAALALLATLATVSLSIVALLSYASFRAILSPPST